MKKLTYLFLALIIVACSSDDEGGNNSNSIDYFFEVEFGGVINRVEGNYSFTLGDITFPFVNPNQCFGSTDGVILSIADITAENYVSGQNMELWMNFDNAQLGSNTGILYDFGGFYIEEYLESISTTGSFVENIGDGIDQAGIITDINITDLGTSGSPPYSFGETIKGSYEKVIYFRSNVTGDYDIPVPIRIEFSAVRL